MITAIAFTTVLGTVSGLILAASGAIAHDLIESVMGHKLHDHAKVGAAKWASIVIGLIAIVLGVLFRTLNVGFLVGWAFNIAASANLPAIVMLLFWRKTSRLGMVAAITVGTISSLTWLMLTKEAFQNVYNMPTSNGIMPFSQPGIVTIPLGFIVLVVVSLLTQESKVPKAAFPVTQV
jgi:cation/acetate symporter